MTRFIALSLALFIGSLMSAQAETAKVSDKPDTAVTDQITAQLSDEGYDVRKVKTEDGLYEVYALKDGQKLEVYMDADLNVVRVKSDD